MQYASACLVLALCATLLCMSCWCLDICGSHVSSWLWLSAALTMICRQARADAAGRESPEEAPAQREIRARSVYERAFTELRADQPDAKQEALMLLEAWEAFEASTTST